MKKILSLIAIVALLTSASAQAQSSTDGIVRSSDYWLAYATKLPIGSTVVVRTSDGQRMTAILAIVDASGITLEPKTRIPEPPRRVSYGELQQLQLKSNGSSIGKAVAIGVGVGAATFVGLMMVLLAGYTD